MKRVLAFLGLILVPLVVLTGCGLVVTSQTPTPEPPPVQPVPPTPISALPQSTAYRAGLPAAAVVVDNLDPGFTIKSGDWGTCAQYDCSGTPYGEDFLFAEPTCDTCQARFDLRVPGAGKYDLYTWWPQGADRATDTPFNIQYSGGTRLVKVDQRSQGSGWYRLDTLDLKVGESVSVTVGGSPSGYANADAVALVPDGSPPPALAARPAETLSAEPPPAE